MCQLREGKIEGRKGEEGEGRKEEEGALSPPIPTSLTPWPHRDAAAVAGRGRRALTFVGAGAAGSASVAIGGVASSAISSDSASVTPALSAASTTPPPLPEAGVSVVLLPTMAASSSPVQPPKHPPLPVRRLPARQQTYRPRPLRALQPTGRAPPRQAAPARKSERGTRLTERDGRGRAHVQQGRFRRSRLGLLSRQLCCHHGHLIFPPLGALCRATRLDLRQFGC